MFIFDKKPKRLSKRELILSQMKHQPKRLMEDEMRDRKHKMALIENEALKSV